MPFGFRDSGQIFQRLKNCILQGLKGTVARDFLLLVFFHELTPDRPLIHTLKYFQIRFRIRGDIRIRR
jgi:hypothetical protein